MATFVFSTFVNRKNTFSFSAVVELRIYSALCMCTYVRTYVRIVCTHILNVCSYFVLHMHIMYIRMCSSSGKYPIEAVRMMAKVCREAEAVMFHRMFFSNIREDIQLPTETGETIAQAAVSAAYSQNAGAIICLTTTGRCIYLCELYIRNFCPFKLSNVCME